MTLPNQLLILGLCLTAAVFVSCSEPNPVDSTPEDGRIHLSLNRTNWHQASRPAQVDRSYHAGRLLWHTPIELVPVEEVYDTETAAGGAAMRVFRMIHRPVESQKSWAGVTTGVTALTQSRAIEFFEVRLKGNTGKLHLEFGRICEDIDGDHFYDYEDQDLNGFADETEDVGLDGLPDELEPGYHPIDNPDPNGDNWFFRGYGKCPVAIDRCNSAAFLDSLEPGGALHYEWLNGTEGNIEDVANFGRPDSEGLTGLGFQLDNNYISYEIDLATDWLMVEGSENQYGWRTFRIPAGESGLIDTTIPHSTVISPDWSNITHVRAWLESDGSGEDTVVIAEWAFTPSDTSGGPTTIVNFVRDFEYEDNRVFDLMYPGEFDPGDSITQLLIYQETYDYSDPEAVPALLQVDPSDSLSHADLADSVRVTQIAPEYYEYYNDNQPHVIFNYGHWVRGALAVYMEIHRAGGATDTIGYLSGDTARLKMLLPATEQYSPSHPTWPLMWRNVYRIPIGVTLNELDIHVFKGLPGNEGSSGHLDYQLVDSINQGSYLEILGLDQYSVTNQKLPDGQIDDRIEVFRPDWGLLILPHRTPFDSDTIFVDDNADSTHPLVARVPTLYNYMTTTERVNNSTYYFRLEITLPSSLRSY